MNVSVAAFAVALALVFASPSAHAFWPLDGKTLDASAGEVDTSTQTTKPADAASATKPADTKPVDAKAAAPVTTPPATTAKPGAPTPASKSPEKSSEKPVDNKPAASALSFTGAAAIPAAKAAVTTPAPKPAEAKPASAISVTTPAKPSAPDAAKPVDTKAAAAATTAATASAVKIVSPAATSSSAATQPAKPGTTTPAPHVKTPEEINAEIAATNKAHEEAAKAKAEEDRIAREKAAAEAKAAKEALDKSKADYDKKVEEQKKKDAASIAGHLEAKGTFKILLELLKTGSITTLKSPGNYTVFAPTDEAWGKFSGFKMDYLKNPDNLDTLKSLLGYHMLNGNFILSKVKGRKVAPNALQGDELHIDATTDNVTIGTAKIIGTDTEASNGTIYILNEVLMPPNLVPAKK